MPRRRPKRRRARRRARTPALARPPGPAESALLSLARQLSALPPDASSAAALEILAGAHAPGAPLPRALATAWARARDDKTAALALAWAREQVRLALEEILAREPRRPPLGDVGTVAWLLLAAVESIAHDLPAAATDRLRVLLDLISGSGAGRDAPASSSTENRRSPA
jgi:hypothetical protein